MLIFQSFNFRSGYVSMAQFELAEIRCITTKQNSYNLDVMRRGNENLIWKMNSYLPSVLFEQPLVEMLMETYWIWRRNCFNSKYTRLSIQFESFSLFLLPSILEYYVLYYSGVPTTHKVNREVRLLTTALLWVLILTIPCLVTITDFLNPDTI